MLFTEQELKRLPTHRLVAIKRKYFPCPAPYLFEYVKEYMAKHAMIKAILATRGHVPRKHEKKCKK